MEGELQDLPEVEEEEEDDTVNFYGTPDFSVPSLEALIQAEHEILGVVTQPDNLRIEQTFGKIYSDKRMCIKTRNFQLISAGVRKKKKNFVKLIKD